MQQDEQKWVPDADYYMRLISRLVDSILDCHYDIRRAIAVLYSNSAQQLGTFAQATLYSYQPSCW